MPYTPILATLGYVFSSDRQRILMVHRNKKAHDHHLGKYNGLGGKLEPYEDVVAGFCRELQEEAGITPTQLELCGTISWPGFGKNGEDWFGFLFRVFSYSGELLWTNPEGDLLWVERDQMMHLNLWEGDRFFLPLVLNLEIHSFHGVMPYQQGRPVSWSYTQISLEPKE